MTFVKRTFVVLKLPKLYSLEVWRILARRKPRYCNHPGLPREGFSTISPTKMNGFKLQSKLGRKKQRQQGNLYIQENLGAYSMHGAPRLFVCSYVASPFGPLRTEKTADFGVESRDPTANLCPSSKIPDFLRVGGGEYKKCDFRGWVFCLFGYSLHRTSDLHAKSMGY